ncbi:MAG TPA: GntR family transcriptional regulator [Steroidobacteraceae bacterium]|nr:GntR family transcriptional regulator [Steroidobacteraceae bacterium]
METQAQWDDSQPIYRQLRDRVVAMILEGLLREGDPLPSVRSVAAEFRINPLTVLRSYQQLVDEQLVEKRRGRGMFVNAGAASALRIEERRRFLSSEWPRVRATIARLGLSVDELLAAQRTAIPAAGAEDAGRPAPADARGAAGGGGGQSRPRDEGESDGEHR